MELDGVLLFSFDVIKNFLTEDIQEKNEMH